MLTMRLEGHRTAVLGAGGAIGRACVRQLAELGGEVAALDRSKTLAESALDGVAGTHRAYEADVVDADAVSAIAEAVWADGPVDGIIYAPGIAMTADVVDMDWPDYRRLMAVNLDGAFHAAQAFVKPMIAAERPGAFVFLSSMAGLRGEAGASAYCASKFGLIGLTQSFAAELTSHHIRVNAVCPGNVDSPLLRQVSEGIAAYRGSSADVVHAEAAKVGAARRLVTADEVASVCVWLVSPAASAVTGTALPVDVGALVG